MRLFLLMLLVLSSTPAFADSASARAATGPAAQLAADFVEMLQSDDVRRIAVLGIDPSAVQDWASVRWLFERHEHIQADLLHASSSVDGTMEIEIAGTAEVLGPSLRRIDLARCWTLEWKADGARLRLTSALTREDRLAAELALAPPDALQQALDAGPCIRAEAFLRTLADRANDHHAAGLPTIAWVEKTSRARRLPLAEAMAVRMRALIEMADAPAEAKQSAQHALRIAVEAGDVASIVSAHYTIAVVDWFANDLDGAAQRFRSLAAYLDDSPDPVAILQALYMAAHLDLDRKPLRDVLASSDALLALLDRFDVPRSRMDVEFLLAAIHRRLRNPEISGGFAQRALASARAIGDRLMQAEALHYVAASRFDRGRLPEARRALDEALPLTAQDSMRSELLNLQGQIALSERSLAEASRAFAESIDIATAVDERASQANGWNGMAQIALAQAQPERARMHAERALQLLQSGPGISRLRESAPIWPVRTTLGEALRALGRDADAERELRLAIAELEAARVESGDVLDRSRALEGNTAPYHDLLDLLVDQRRHAEALDVAEGTKARALRDALAQGQVDPLRGVPAAEQAREHALAAALAAANRDVLVAADAQSRTQLEPARDAARAALQRFRSELFLRHPRLPLLRADEPRDMAGAMPDGTVVVEFAVMANRTLAFVVTRNGDALAVDVVPIDVSRADLREHVEDLARRVADRDPQYLPHAVSLYERLLRPIGNRLDGARAIAVVPDDVLWRLPLQVVVDAANPVLAATPLYRAPSLRALAIAATLSAPAKRPTRLLALGNPRILDDAGRRRIALQRGIELGALPDAEREVQALARLYGARRSTVLVGAAARERVLKAQAGDYDVIHLATHGLLDDSAPIHSALVLAAGRSDTAEDGLLEAREISDLSLRARLAVLSACETGRGPVRAAEGVIGMSWAFMAAGVATVVVSDWKTDSAATKRLMVEFHRQLIGGAGAAIALQRAQRTLREDPRYAHPYYWAPFVVVGGGQ